jgi:hypothetical protein
MKKTTKKEKIIMSAFLLSAAVDSYVSGLSKTKDLNENDFYSFFDNSLLVLKNMLNVFGSCEEK